MAKKQPILPDHKELQKSKKQKTVYTGPERRNLSARDVKGWICHLPLELLSDPTLKMSLEFSFEQWKILDDALRNDVFPHCKVASEGIHLGLEPRGERPLTTCTSVALTYRDWAYAFHAFAREGCLETPDTSPQKTIAQTIRAAVDMATEIWIDEQGSEEFATLLPPSLHFAR